MFILLKLFNLHLDVVIKLVFCLLHGLLSASNSLQLLSKMGFEINEKAFDLVH